MPVSPFGGNGAGPSFSGSGNIWSDGIPLPTGRRMANGSQGALIQSISGIFGGRGATRTGKLQLGSAITQDFSVPSANPFDVGLHTTNGWLVQGGTARFSILFPGQINIGYGGSVGTINDGAGLSRVGTLGGSYGWAQAPSAPTMQSITPAGDGASAFTQFAGETDNGGSTVSGWLLQRATNVDFTAGVVSTLIPTRSGNAGGNTITGLTPGVRYYWRVAARNLVSDTAGSLGGPWSNVIGATQPSGSEFGRIYDGTAWVPLDSRIASSLLAYDRGVDGRVWTGTSWVPIG